MSPAPIVTTMSPSFVFPETYSVISLNVSKYSQILLTLFLCNFISSTISFELITPRSFSLAGYIFASITIGTLLKTFTKSAKSALVLVNVCGWLFWARFCFDRI